MPGPRLELTWPNKEQFLLTPKDDDGKPVWVPRSHPAAHEVRLTRPVGAVGATNDADPHADSTVFVGDSLDAMKVLCEVPEWATHYRGKVKLIYADPPFNTGQTFTHYDDWMEHSTWLSFMRERLLLMKDLLAPDGSVWIHLDDAEVHRMRCLLDEIFGADNFIATVIWEKTDSPRMDAKRFSSAHDTLLAYARTSAWAPNKKEQLPSASDYPHIDENGRRFSRRELRKWGSNSLRADRPNLWYPIEAPNGESVFPIRPDGQQGNWRWQPSKVAAERDRIQWLETPLGWQPYVKTYQDEGKRPIPPKTFWPVRAFGGNPVGKEEVKALFPEAHPFATPKPEALLSEVLRIATDPGDIVLDPFAGSGTTAAVAQKMGRRWLTVELSPANAETFVVPRLTKVVEGADPGGITEATDWAGGGGFRVVEVEPSLYEVGPGGMVLLRDDIGADDLARAMCGQLRFTHTPDDPHFAGRRGRMMLAVVPGVVGAEQVDDLLAALPEGTRLTVAAGAFVPGVADHLADASRGSRALKIPRDVLARSLRRATDRQEADR